MNDDPESDRGFSCRTLLARGAPRLSLSKLHPTSRRPRIPTVRFV
jgi:hypothetical protein